MAEIDSCSSYYKHVYFVIFLFNLEIRKEEIQVQI